ncbi:amyloid fiber anchoring/assembly protein TapA [Mesobacillus selenatarsenatis]|uniref:amyloid fiber anchoring/assembly protein TapA n=1 Tax=Mesobacillus selenatarsenatis TaxID=388741 RepID=UPI0018DB957E|nr:amyloid fiber anchoring/assembly protein TapA [Mesobacillus selenatarsenatis]
MKRKFTNFVLQIIHTLSSSKQKENREGRTIRYSRSRKFRKRYDFFRKSMQVLLVWYLLIFTVIQLNSFTNAAFNDVEELQASIHVKWPVDEWDKSSLDFDVAGLERGGSCQPPEVYAEIYNNGEDMTFSTWTWELFKVGTGQETKTPISPVLESGEVPMIKSGEKERIVTTKLQELPGDGHYRFKVTKPDRPGQEAIWSEPIEIEGCIAGKVETEQTVTEEKPTESIEKTDTNTSQTTEETKDPPEEGKESPDSESANEASEEENTESSSSNEEDGTNQESSSEDQTEEQQPADSTNGSDESNGN